MQYFVRAHLGNRAGILHGELPYLAIQIPAQGSQMHVHTEVHLNWSQLRILAERYEAFWKSEQTGRGVPQPESCREESSETGE